MADDDYLNELVTSYDQTLASGIDWWRTITPIRKRIVIAAIKATFAVSEHTRSEIEIFTILSLARLSSLAVTSLEIACRERDREINTPDIQ